MDLGGIYMNKSKHSSDLDIASLHKALHDLQSYMHLILRIIGGLAGFTSDHLSSELINELTKISHDSTVQVLLPYKMTSVRTMTSVPQSYYMDSNNGDHSTSFDVGVKDSSWSSIHYSTFFSNLAKSLPASSATDSRESHQLGLNQVVRPNPQKPPISLFATYNSSLKQDKFLKSRESKLDTQYLEASQPMTIKEHQILFNNQKNNADLNISSEKEMVCEALNSRKLILSELNQTTQSRNKLITIDECEGSKQFSRTSLASSNKILGYPEPSSTTSVEVSQLFQGQYSSEKGKRLGEIHCAESLNTSFNALSGCKSGLSQVKFNNNMADYVNEPITVFSKEKLDIKTDKEHKHPSKIIELFKTNVISKINQTKIVEGKLIEMNCDPLPLNNIPEKSLTNLQGKESCNDPGVKISLVDVKLLQENVEPDRTTPTKKGKKTGHESSAHDLHIILSQKITDQPLACIVEKDKEKSTTIESHVKIDEHNSEKSFFPRENVENVSMLPQNDIEQSNVLMTTFKKDNIRKDDCDETMDEMPLSVSGPQNVISQRETLNLKNISSLNFSVPPLRSSIEKFNELKDPGSINEFKSGGNCNQNDSAAFLKTALESLTGESKFHDLSSAKNPIEFTKPPVSSNVIGMKVEKICFGKPKVNMASITDCDPTSKIDQRIGDANVTAKGWLNSRYCVNKLPEVIVATNKSTKNDFQTKKCKTMSRKFKKNNPSIMFEGLKEIKKKTTTFNQNIKQLSLIQPELHLKLPDMPDLVNDNDNLSQQNSLLKLNKNFMDESDIKLGSNIVKQNTSSKLGSPECLKLQSKSSSELKEVYSAINSDEEFVGDKQIELEVVDAKVSTKITPAKFSEVIMEFEDTSDTHEFSDDDSEGKLIIDIPEVDLAHNTLDKGSSTEGKFNHPKKNWRIKMLQDSNQVDDSGRNIDSVRRLKAPSLIAGKDLIHLSQHSLSNMSADSTLNRKHAKLENEKLPLQISTTGDDFKKVSFPLGNQMGSTLSACDKDVFKNTSSKISANDSAVNATELFHNKLKHLPVKIQQGLRKRNEVLMKYLSTAYPNSQSQGTLSTDFCYRSNNPDDGISTDGERFVSQVLDNSARIVDKKTDHKLFEYNIKQRKQDKGVLDFAESYVRAQTNKSIGIQNPELELEFKFVEERNIDSGNSFLNYILRGYNTSGEEGSSQGSYEPGKINESSFTVENVGQHPLLSRKGQNSKERDYTPKEKRRKTCTYRNFDTDHIRRRVKNNEASKRHRESKKKLQKEAFDNITKLEEINLRLRQKAEKLDSAVKQVLKVIATLSTNS